MTPAREAIRLPDLLYRLPAKLAWAGTEPVAGELWLLRHSEFRAGPQTLLERLNERVHVLPVVCGGDTHLVNRELIDWVEPGPGVDAGLVGPVPYAVTHEERVCVHMISGMVFEGVLALEMPEGFNRASDFLNLGDDFFTLRSGPRALLVNKRRIREMLVEGRTPPPPRPAA
jgi:hypothetical protein